MNDMPECSRSVALVEKLSFDLPIGFRADSGIRFQFGNGRSLTIVANAFPCTLAVHGAPGFPIPFAPEYPIVDYHRRPLGA